MPPRPPQDLQDILARSRSQAGFRLLVFGGSFNPIHNGHLQLAREILGHHLGDALLFVPAKSPPHKLNQALAPEADRLAMLKLATAAIPNVYVSDIEFHRSGPSYTIDTLTALQAELPGVTLVFVMGMDSLASLHTWHRVQALVQDWPFVIYPRPGIPLPENTTLQAFFGEAAARRLLASVHALPLSTLSSSEIRQRLATGKSIDNLLPPAVAGYILDNGLYKK